MYSRSAWQGSVPLFRRLVRGVRDPTDNAPFAGRAQSESRVNFGERCFVEEGADMPARDLAVARGVAERDELT